MLAQVIIGIFLSLIISIISYGLNLLTKSGFWGAFIIGAIVFGLGGLAWAVPLLIFFFSSSILSNLGKEKKDELKSLMQKPGARDLWQVLANGGCASFLVILNFISPSLLFYVLYSASLAGVCADTWGTEIGTLSKSSPVLIINFKKVYIGTSGGITVLGLLGSFLGSALISLSIILFKSITPTILLVIIIWGFLASIFDSVLGATIQAQYKCLVCKKITERKIHCGKKTVLDKGISWINNDWVNFLTSLFPLPLFFFLR